MKKALSVLALSARQRLFALLALSLLLAAVQSLLFLLLAANAPGPEAAVEAGRLHFVLLAVYLLLYALLCRFGCERGGSRPGYTLARLGTGEFGAMLCTAAVNAACFLILLAAAAAVALVLVSLEVRSLPEEMRNAQTLLLAFYRSPYLHSLLPLSDWSRALRIFFLCLFCGLGTAGFSFWRRRGSTGGFAVLCAVSAPFLFPGSVSRDGERAVIDIFIVLAGVFCAGFSLDNMRHAAPLCEPERGVNDDES